MHVLGKGVSWGREELVGLTERQVYIMEKSMEEPMYCKHHSLTTYQVPGRCPRHFYVQMTWLIDSPQLISEIYLDTYTLDVEISHTH